MTKRKQHARSDLGPPDWLPLDAAFERIQDGFGSRDLAAGELYQAMLDGRLGSGAVWLPPLPAGQHVGPISTAGKKSQGLKPEFWQQFEGLVVTDRGLRAWPTKGRMLVGRWRFFVRRADLDRLYPASAKGDGTKPPRRRTGPVPTHDWHSICGEIACRCVDPKTKRVQVPKNESRLAQAMLQWCQDNYGLEPAESEMREAVRRVCATLRQV
jgi:hypothetical protein